MKTFFVAVLLGIVILAHVSSGDSGSDDGNKGAAKGGKKVKFLDQGKAGNGKGVKKWSSLVCHFMWKANLWSPVHYIHDTIPFKFVRNIAAPLYKVMMNWISCPLLLKPHMFKKCDGVAGYKLVETQENGHDIVAFTVGGDLNGYRLVCFK